MGHVIASYLRQVWDKNDWLYEGQHGFTPGYSCESKVIAVCQDISDSLDNGDNIDANIFDFSKTFDLDPYIRLIKKIANSGVDSRGWCMCKGIPFRSHAESRGEGATTFTCTAIKVIRSSSVPSLRKLYLEEYGINY